MGKGGRKYRLLIYEQLLNRWWPLIVMQAVFIFLIVGVLWTAEKNYPKPADDPFPILSTSGNMIMIAAGLLSLLAAFFLLVMRKMAYIQLFDDHFRMATPFFRMNIAYKRILNSNTTQMNKLFPPKDLSRTKLNIVDSVMNDTAIVIRLRSYPLSRQIMSLFLSPFFFHNNSPHFVLLLDDWLLFTTELEGRLTLFKNPGLKTQPVKRSSSNLLEDLNRKDS